MRSIKGVTLGFQSSTASLSFLNARLRKLRVKPAAELVECIPLGLAMSAHNNGNSFCRWGGEKEENGVSRGNLRVSRSYCERTDQNSDSVNTR